MRQSRAIEGFHVRGDFYGGMKGATTARMQDLCCESEQMQLKFKSHTSRSVCSIYFVPKMPLGMQVGSSSKERTSLQAWKVDLSHSHSCSPTCMYACRHDTYRELCMYVLLPLRCGTVESGFFG